MVRQGYNCFQNADANFAKEEFGSKATVRGMTQNWFVKQLKNGIVAPRTWLMYSPHKEAAFGFCCLLLPSSPLNSRSSFELEAGFNSWKKWISSKTTKKILTTDNHSSSGKKWSAG